MNKIETALAITGVVSNSLLQAAAQSNKALAGMGKAANEAQRKLDALAKVDKNQAALKVQIDKLAAAKLKLKNIDDQLSDSSNKSALMQKRLNNSRVDAQIKVTTLENKIKSLTEGNKKYVNSVRSSFGPIGRMRQEQDNLRVSAEKLNKVHERAAILEKKRQAQKRAMSDARAGMVDATALAYMARGPINAMLEGEMSSFYLSTVINAKDKNAAMQKSFDMGKKIAQSGIAGYNEAMEIQYALNSAGFSSVLATASAPVVASVAKITKGTSAEVGEIIATTYNNLGNQMQGGMDEKLKRIGELFTRTQFKFQIRDFNQIGESFKYAAGPIMNANANLEQSFTILGKLNDAGLRGGQAGTAFAAMMRQVIKGTKDYAPQLAYAADGTMDIIGTLKNIKKDMRGMDSAMSFRFLSDLGGDEGARALAPLLKDLDALSAANEDVKQSSKGIIDRNMEAYLKTNTARIEAMKGSATLAGQSLGGAFGPAIQSVAATIGSAAVRFGMFADSHPKLMTLLGTILSVAVGAKLMYSGMAYFFGMFGGGITNIIIFWNWLKRINLAIKGVGVVRGACSKTLVFLGKGIAFLSKSLMALLTGPHGLLIAGIAAVVVAIWYLYRNWDTVKKGLMQWWKTLGELWDKFSNKFPVAAEIIKGAAAIIAGCFDGIWQALKKVWEWGNKAWKYITAGGGSQGNGAITPTAPGGGRGFANGGFITRPTWALAGEGGKTELVLPLSDRTRTQSLLGQAGLAGCGGISLSFSPQVTIQGNADESAVRRAMQFTKRDLKRMLSDIMADERMVSLA